MTRKLTTAAMAAVMLAAGCTAPSQPYLDHYRQACTAGDRAACDLIPPTQARVNAEKQDQAGKVAAGILLGLSAVAVGAAAGYAASRPVYQPAPVIILCRPWAC
jgi:hypothetical protein